MPNCDYCSNFYFLLTITGLIQCFYISPSVLSIIIYIVICKYTSRCKYVCIVIRKKTDDSWVGQI